MAYCGASQDRAQLEDHVGEGDPKVGHSPPHHAAARVLEDAWQYRLQYEATELNRGFDFSFTFYSETRTFLSGAEGIRTSDLRRAKSGYYLSSTFAVVQKHL